MDIVTLIRSRRIRRYRVHFDGELTVNSVGLCNVKNLLAPSLSGLYVLRRTHTLDNVY